jgi:hypothetical protein
MPRGLPRTVKDHLEKARSAALAAVEVYNKPGPRFRTAHYVVLIVIAWTALFHAYFYHQGRKPWYRRGRRYQRIDGEPRHWELSECLAQYFGDTDPPERANLRFLSGLRNKIEHRHLPEIDPTLYGECQAALLNLDDFLTRHFGARYSLAETLAVSLQFSRVIPGQKTAAIRLALASLGKGVLDYAEAFRAALSDETISSSKYSFRVFLIPKTANRPTAADVAVEFVHYDPANAEQQEQLKQVTALIKERHVPVANLDLLKPKQVVTQVASRLPSPFSIDVHTRAWRHWGVRPPAGNDKPERTKAQYCVYDKAHKDYLYTQAWVELLCKELSDATTYLTVAGRPAPAPLPVPQPAA